MRALVFVVAVAVASVQPAFSQQPDPRRDSGTAIAEMIRLLERKDFVTLLNTFAVPEKLKEMVANKTIDAVAAEFGERKADDVLEMLKAASKIKPTFNPDGTRADYRFDKPIGGDGRVTMVKIGEYWFIR